jgi:hypothetical protein
MPHQASTSPPGKASVASLSTCSCSRSQPTSPSTKRLGMPAKMHKQGSIMLVTCQQRHCLVADVLCSAATASARMHVADRRCCGSIGANLHTTQRFPKRARDTQAEERYSMTCYGDTRCKNRDMKRLDECIACFRERNTHLTAPPSPPPVRQ